MLKHVLVLLLCACTAFAADRDGIDPQIDDQSGQTEGVSAFVVGSAEGIFIHVAVDTHADRLTEAVRVGFGLTDLAGDRHPLVDAAFAPEMLLAHADGQGRIHYETILAVDTAARDALVAALVDQGLLARNTVADAAKAAGSFTSKCRVTRNYNWKIDKIITHAFANFSCTGCTIDTGFAETSLENFVVTDSCGGCSALNANQFIALDTFDYTTTAEVSITEANWTGGGELLNYYLYDSLPPI